MADLSIGTTIGGFAAYHAGNYFPDKTTVGLGSVNNWGASDSHTTASSTTYATSAAVKAAYDAAMAAINAIGAPTWAEITGKPATYAPSAHTHTAADITNLNDQSSAATANTLALRDGSADISVRLLRSNYADQSTISGAIAFRVNNSTDNYTRYCNSPSAVMTWLGAAPSNHNHDALYYNINRGTTTDFNAALSDGAYYFGSAVSNSPRSGTIYGRLLVYVSDGGTHNNSNNWIWQEYMDTSGYRYYRYKVNAGAWTAWVANVNGNQLPNAADVGAMADGGSYGTVTLSNWVRTTGQTGWYSQTYGGGVYMIDTTWLRSYNNKSFYTAGEGAFGSNVTAYYSDERLKEVIEELDPEFCLDAVNRWRKVRYHANDLGAKYGYDPKKLEVGLLAGEVNKDFPELTPLAPFDYETLEDGSIISKSGENYKTMTYERVVAVQAAAITALTRRLEKLEGKLNA